MKFSYSWLQDHLDTSATVTQIADALTALGIEVEEIIDPASKLNGFVIGHVVKAERHPNADRLSLCTVEDGSLNAAGEKIQYQVVCGAPNVRTDMKVAFAKAGVVIPNTGLPLKKGVIRGIESQGMLCSAAELLLGADSDGIMDLESTLLTGTPLTQAFMQMTNQQYAHCLDPIIDVSITPNRSDCFSIRGLARDLAALKLGTLKPHVIKSAETAGASDIQICIQKETTNTPPLDHTPHFAARVIKGVKNGKSPVWLQQKLASAGVKSISALVDVTNLMCLDQGRPMHVFDKNKINGNTLTIRLARTGEQLLGLNDKDYGLEPGMIIITDGSAPLATHQSASSAEQTATTTVASPLTASTASSPDQHQRILSLAGIMGGRDSAVDDDTCDVILESALFDAATIARAGQKTSIVSDARMRFERGVDANDVLTGLDHATTLILELCGGKAYDIVQAGTLMDSAKMTPHIQLRHEKLKSLMGADLISLDESASILSRLGCTVISQDTTRLVVSPPAYRHDLTIEEDLVEEVLRLYGYDAIPEAPLPLQIPAHLPQTRARLSSYFTSKGYNEAYTWSFVAAEVAALFGKGVPLDKPLTADMAVMRPSVLPGLLKIANHAQKRSQPNVSYFEVAPQFHLIERASTEAAHSLPSTISEKRTLSGLRVFHKAKRHWQKGLSTPDFFSLKNEVLSALSLFGVNNVQIEAVGPSYYHPGRVATLRQGKTILATLGEIHPKICQDMDVQGAVLGFEVMLEALPGALGTYDILSSTTETNRKKTQPKAFTPAIYQSMTRDFAFWVDVSVASGQLVALVQKVDKALITAIDVFDVYIGDKAPVGKKSIAIEVTLQSTTHTLSLEEASALQIRITEAVLKGCGGQLRDAG